MRTNVIILASVGLWGGCTGLDAPGQGGDSFASCCEGLGTCIAEGLAGDDVAARLSSAECGAELLCAPSAWVQDPNAVAPACRTAGDREGRCLPACLPEVAAQADRLQPESCGAGLLCVPCFDPVSGEDSQACRIGVDVPHEAPDPFEACCSALGRCVPSEVLAQSVAPEERARLGVDTCLDEALCVPERWLGDEGARADVCHTLGGREGRCLSSCLPEIAAQGATLAQETCEAGELCAPCTDPLTGEDTAVCRIGDDQPVEPPSEFASCCEGTGRCVPQSLVLQSISAQDAERLSADSCAQEDRCVPEAWLGEEGPSAQVCWSDGGREGRCLPSCLPSVAPLADQLTSASCGHAQLCVPCFDPLSGDETGACRIAGDQPYGPPRPFENCCGGEGRCVPDEALLRSVTKEDAAQLGKDACGEAAMCVPEGWLTSTGASVGTCRAAGDLEGRCMPRCLPDIAAQGARLQQRGCGEEALCVPCFDPLTGHDTGACGLGTDEPREAPKTFADCCGGGGSCVPEEALVSALTLKERGRLGPGSCSVESHAICVPDGWGDPTGPTLETCRAAGDIEGRCTPSCLPAVANQADRLQQASCADAHLCVPCYDPLTGADTDACRVRGDKPVDPPRAYERCCGEPGAELGTCLPVELISPQQLKALPAGLCSQPNTRCVPSELTQTPPQLEACEIRLPILAPVEGVCLPACFVPAGQRPGVPRAGCAAAHVCAPCSSLGSALPGCE